MQTVVVSVWGARSNAALGIVGMNVSYCVHLVLYIFPVVGGGGMFYVDLNFKFKGRFNYFIYYFIC